MKFRWDNKYLHWGVTAFMVIAASMLFYYGIFHMKTLITGIKTFLGIMAPIVYGVILAYVLIKERFIYRKKAGKLSAGHVFWFPCLPSGSLSIL